MLAPALKIVKRATDKMQLQMQLNKVKLALK